MLCGFFRNDFLHLVPLFLHIRHKLELCTGADKIVFRVIGLKIKITV